MLIFVSHSSIKDIFFNNSFTSILMLDDLKNDWCYWSENHSLGKVSILQNSFWSIKNVYWISEGYFRLDPDKVKHFPKIPVQPISYEGAYSLLRWFFIHWYFRLFSRWKYGIFPSLERVKEINFKSFDFDLWSFPHFFIRAFK